MTLFSTSLHNSHVTNSTLRLVKAVEVRPIAEQVEAYALAKAEGRYAMTPNWEVVGECGHRLEVVGAYRAPHWQARIDAGSKNRKRCDWCPPKK